MFVQSKPMSSSCRPVQKKVSSFCLGSDSEAAVAYRSYLLGDQIMCQLDQGRPAVAY